VREPELRKQILRCGEELGFRNPGIARLAPLDREPYFSDWLAQGRAGDMRFLEHHKKARLDPHSRFPWARSVLSASYPYAPPARSAPAPWQEEMRGRVAAYALGRDYHLEMDALLKTWAGQIATLLPDAQSRTYVDTGPVFEHEWAERAGVGWTGKHTLTLDREAGSWGFLGEILLEVELEPDTPSANHCGTCTRCIDSCPTEAIRGPYDLDPRLCISYLTIEHKGLVDRALRPQMGEWLFGCDLCQVACPWNGEGDFNPKLHPRLDEILALNKESFAKRFVDTPLERTGHERLKRNAAIVAGNTANPEILGPLASALEDPSDLVRAHATWAVGQIRSEPRRRQSLLEKMTGDEAALVVEEAMHCLREESA
jgi:epoxyqueuosine reductase